MSARFSGSTAALVGAGKANPALGPQAETFQQYRIEENRALWPSAQVEGASSCYPMPAIIFTVKKMGTGG